MFPTCSRIILQIKSCSMRSIRTIRDNGATPATIAILNGEVKVGLNKDELDKLARPSDIQTIKTSRRDFAYVIANKCNGGTTVAGTLIVAKEAGIRVFATGGLGGVHRNGENTFDISADLTELGKTPVAVVSSGIKSILDIPKTLEYLETQGVFVATLGQSKAFPAFYCQTSGCESPYNIQDAKTAARIIKSHLEFGLQSGLLFAVPVPKQFAMDEQEMNDLIEKALASAGKDGISGKSVTPYLLAYIADLTKGLSLETNIALIKNNARLAADIAVELSKLDNVHEESWKERSNGGNQPVIIGASILDCCATLKGDNIRLDGRIHAADFKLSAGGVGRNIAEAVTKLGAFPIFISTIGRDYNGDYLCSSLPKTSLKYVNIIENYHTAQCVIVFDSKGECKMLLGDMEVHAKITPDMILNYQDVIKKCPLMVLDGNLSVATLDAALNISGKYDIPVLFEPTDAPLASKPFQTDNWKSLTFITPNLIELKEIARFLEINISSNYSSSEIISEAGLLAKQVAKHVPNVIVTLGSKGLLIARSHNATQALLCKIQNNEAEIQLRHYPAEQVPNIVNVSGAGDCLTSGLIVAMLKGLSEERCVHLGYAAARCSLLSQNAVPNRLFDETHEAWKSKAKYVNL